MRRVYNAPMWMRISAIRKNAFFQGSLFLTVANLFGGVINYAFNFVAVRTLGPDGFGILNTFFAYTAMLGIPLMVFHLRIIQKMGSDSDATHAARTIEMWTYTQVQKYKWLILFYFCITPFTPKLFGLPWYAAYSVILLIFMSVYGILYDSILTGLQIFFLPAIISMGIGIIKLCGALGGLIGFDPLISIVVSIVLGTLLRFYLSYRIVRRNIKDKKVDSPTVPFRTQLHGRNLLMATSVISMTLFGSIDMVIITRILSTTDAGYYAAWVLLARIILFVTSPSLQMAYTFFAHQKSAQWHRLSLLISLSGFFVCALMIWYVYDTYGSLLIRLILGARFLPIRTFTGWAAIYGSVIVATTLLNNFFVARGQKVIIILPISLVCYCAGVWYFGRTLATALQFNCIFAGLLLIIYLLAYAFMRIQIHTSVSHDS